MYNCFGVKLLVETGAINILAPFSFFHFISTCLMSLFIKNESIISTWQKSVCLSLTALPIFLFSLYFHQISLINIMCYFLFLFAIIAGLISLTYKLIPINNYQRLFGFILLSFLWGITIIFESIPGISSLLSSLTISYHYLLILDGILHLSTCLFACIFIVFFLKGHYETN